MTTLEHLKSSPNFLDSRSWNTDTSASYLDDPFDSQNLKKKCAKIELIVKESDSIEAPQDLTEDLIRLGIEYATVRIPSRHYSLVTRLATNKFVPVDSIIEFSKVPELQGFPSSIQNQVSGFETELEDLCANSFRNSRFHNDPILGSDVAESVYRSWAKNIISGSAADICHTAYSETGDFAGFVSAQAKSEFCEIGLIAVKPEHSGKGLGKQLVQSVENWSKEKGISKLNVKTQSFNLAAIKLYESCGFKIQETYTTLRWSKTR